jgi:hypothetical protein
MNNRGMRTFTKAAGAGGASAAVSVTLHALLIAAAIIATAPEVISRKEIPEIFEQIAKFLAPPERLGGQSATREQLKFVALGDPTADVRGAKLVRPEEIKPTNDRPVSGVDFVTAAAAPAVAGTQDSVFTLIEVDSAAVRYAWSAAPAYPQGMLDAKKEGYVKAQWVVDEAGYADTSTFKLIDWTGQEFAKAVRDALPFMRFSPAKMGTQSVKQLVQQEFTFRINNVITPVAPGATKKP